MKKKLILIICLVLGIVCLFTGSIAYYRITVKGNISASSGNAVFVLKDNNSNDLNNKTITLNNGNKVNPGDSGSFNITLDASGSSVDMYATLEIDRGSLPTNLKFYTTSDNKSELHKYYSFLEKNGTNSETLTIYWYWNPYIDDEEDNKFINKSNLEATIKVSAVQISEYAVMKNGFNFTYDQSLYTDTSTEFWDITYRPYIRTIKFDNDLSNLPSSCTEENLCWDITEEGSSKKVYGYLIDSGLTVTETEESDEETSTTIEKTLYNLYIVSEAPIFAPSDCYGIFGFFGVNTSASYAFPYSNLISIDFNNNFNTSKVENMSMMFFTCMNLVTLDLSNFNTSKVTDMSSMFYYCSSLTSLDLSNFNTSNVTYMFWMFFGCSLLTSLDLSSFNTSNVINMEYMFFGCSLLTSLDLSNFNTSNVSGMRFMFWNCTSLTSLDLSSFNTSNVTNMSYMFYNCSSLTSLDLSSFNTSNVTNMSYMFYNCSSLTSLDLDSFNTSLLGNLAYMFYNCEKLSTTINYTNTKPTGNYIMTFDVRNMFYNAATEEGAKVIVNYIEGGSELVDEMIATKSSNSNVIKGSQI